MKPYEELVTELESLIVKINALLRRIEDCVTDDVIPSDTKEDIISAYKKHIKSLRTKEYKVMGEIYNRNMNNFILKSFTEFKITEPEQLKMNDVSDTTCILVTLENGKQFGANEFKEMVHERLHIGDYGDLDLFNLIIHYGEDEWSKVSSVSMIKYIDTRILSREQALLKDKMDFNSCIKEIIKQSKIY